MKVHELFETKERSILSVMGKQPEHFQGDFICDDNDLTSLKGAPKTVNGHFSCADNDLTSLKGAPKIITGDFVCSNNALTSLHDIHKYIKDIGGGIWFSNNPITSHILGLLLIKNLKSINLDGLTGNLLEASKIINKHLASRRDLIDCQEELISSGFKEYAKL